MLARREWREGFLAERMQDEFYWKLNLIETEANALDKSMRFPSLSFPGIRAPLANKSQLAVLCAYRRWRI